MERHLNLIKTEYQEMEKRVFPRFPFSYLTFKNEGSAQKVFEIVDISYTGMQLSLKDGGHDYIPGAEISGVIHWKSLSLNIKGSVKWVNGQRVGVEYSSQDEIKSFLSIDNILAGMKSLIGTGVELEVPKNLAHWLRADGPFELFIWSHSDGELSRFQFIIMENFVEWQDGKGVQTGRVVTKRDMDTPLFSEDEFVFQMDEGVDMEKIGFAKRVLDGLSSDHLADDVKNFLKMKLGS